MANAAKNAVATTTPNTGLSTLQAQFQDPAFWLKEKVDEDTGEVKMVPRYRYAVGQPLGYRFDAKAGVFNINGGRALDGKTFSFQPIAFSFRSADLFKKGLKKWAEFFFIDENDNVSAIMFHGFSVESIQKLANDLYYSDKDLTGVVLTVTPKAMKNKDGLGQFFIAEFDFVPAPDADKTRELRYFAKNNRIYRQDTTSDTAEHGMAMNYYDVHASGATEATDEPETGASEA